MNEKDISNCSALALVSGGLDSQLAAKVVSEQGVEVIGANFRTGFSSEGDRELFSKIEEDTGIDIRFLSVDEEEYLKIIKDPEHGYGSAMNPCLDCRILVLREAKKYMEEIGADFAITGEVLGQRPMTQRKGTLELIKRKSGLSDRLLRPLSAKLMDPTVPEEEGCVNRDDLLDISGRSRKRQLELAEKYGLNNYSQPAGGCLLTEEEFGHRIQELFDHKGREESTLKDLKLLKHGRHFRLPDGSKAIIGRNEEENEELQEFLNESYWRLELESVPGPLTLVTGNPTEKDFTLAARLTARYSQGRDKKEVEVVLEKGDQEKCCRVEPIDPDAGVIEDLRIEIRN